MSVWVKHMVSFEIDVEQWVELWWLKYEDGNWLWKLMIVIHVVEEFYLLAHDDLEWFIAWGQASSSMGYFDDIGF